MALILAKGIVVLGIIMLLQAGQVSFGHAMFFAPAPTVGFWGRYLGVGDLTAFPRDRHRVFFFFFFFFLSGDLCSGRH